MTIASTINAIAVANGGTAAKKRSISAAIDALNDALASSDQQSSKTIEGAIALLGEHIGTGGGTHDITIDEVEGVEISVYEYSLEDYGPVGDPITEATAGDVLGVIAGLAEGTEGSISGLYVLVGGETTSDGLTIGHSEEYGDNYICFFSMPDRDDVFITAELATSDDNSGGSDLEK